MDDLFDVPDDAVAPRYMTMVHPRATGSYGRLFIEWANENPDLNPRRTEGLRWWQQVVASRLLEHDEDGLLVWRNVIVTCARQVGKSWLLRALIMWRIQNRHLFGDEDQTVVSTAHKMTTAQEVFRPAARWARARRDDGWNIRLANGDEKVESPDGGRWLLQAATDGLSIGYSLSVLCADESWKLKRPVIEAADAALVEAVSPQLWLVSTAGDSDSDLLSVYRARALDELEQPDNTLILEWSAAKDTAIDSVFGWRMASPCWSARREAEVRDKLLKLDELEFRLNYRNEWLDIPHGRRGDSGEQVFKASEWEDAGTYEANGVPPSAAAVESWFGEGVAVARATALPAGRVGVTVSSYPDARGAADAVQGVPVVLIGKSLASDPAFTAIAVTPKGSTSRASVQELRRLMDEDVIRHDNSSELSRQVLNVRASQGADGPRVRSTGRLDAVKALCWAVESTRLANETPAVY